MRNILTWLLFGILISGCKISFEFPRGFDSNHDTKELDPVPPQIPPQENPQFARAREQLDRWQADQFFYGKFHGPELDIQNYVDVRDFGAKGDGVSDNYEALKRAASYLCQNPHTALVFPQGVYAIQTVRQRAQPVSHIKFTGCRNVAVVGLGATISVKGDFHRARADVIDPDRYPDLYHGDQSQIIPFFIQGSQDFLIGGLGLKGNTRLMTRDDAVEPNDGSAIVTSNCQRYTLIDMAISNFSTDGVMLGKHSRRADQNALLLNLTSDNNARQGLTILQLRGAIIRNSQFSFNGVTLGSYAGHSPAAGVDIEPPFYPTRFPIAEDGTNPNIDVMTGRILFDRSRFVGNRGENLVISLNHAIELVQLRDPYIEANTFTSGPMLKLGIPNLTMESSPNGPGCHIQTHGGYISASEVHHLAPAQPVRTTIRGCVIRSRGRGLKSSDDAYLLLADNRFIGEHTGAIFNRRITFPGIDNSEAVVQDNTFFYPQGLWGASGQLASNLGRLYRCKRNHFRTNTMLPGGFRVRLPDSGCHGSTFEGAVAPE